MTENDLNFMTVLLIAYFLPAVIQWAVLLIDTRRGLVEQGDFVERASWATWPLVNIGGLFVLCFRVLYRAVKPK